MLHVMPRSVTMRVNSFGSRADAKLKPPSTAQIAGQSPAQTTALCSPAHTSGPCSAAQRPIRLRTVHGTNLNNGNNQNKGNRQNRLHLEELLLPGASPL